MNKTMSKDAQQKIALAVIMYVIAFVVFNNLFIEGLNKKIKAAKQRIQIANLENAQGISKIANINQVKDKYEKKKAEYQKMKKAFISENEKKVILKEIEEAGKTHGIKIETISLTKAEASITSNIDGTPVLNEKGTEIDMKKYKEYKINMTFKSSYPNLAEFIQAVERLEKLVLVQSMNLNSDGREISAKLLLKCYLVEDGGV